MRGLLNKLKENNILLRVVDGKLKVFAPDAELSPEILSAIKERKEELLAFLSGNGNAGTASAAIPHAPVQADYPVSSPQRRMWILSQLEASNIAYNMPGVYEFEGTLQAEGLKYAFAQLVKRHESLRTIFRENNSGDIRQVILQPDEAGFTIDSADLRKEQAPQITADELVQAACIRPFTISAGPLLRASLYQVADNQWVFCYVMHHIIGDGWSVQLLFHELLQQYNDYCSGIQEPPVPLRVQYKDYAVWQLEKLLNSETDRDKNYWLQQFKDPCPALELPADRPRPAMRTYNGGVVQQEIDENLVAAFKSFCQQEGATLFMGLLAAVNALVYRYTGQEDITAGSPVAGRIHTDLEEQIGCFVNTLPLRTRFSGQEDFSTLLKTVRRITLDAYEHQAYPLDELTDALAIPYDRGRNPLFDMVVVLQNTSAAVQKNRSLPENLAVKAYKRSSYPTSKFDLTFNFFEESGGLKLNLEYNSDLFDQATATRAAQHLEQMIRVVLAAPQLSINKLDYLSAAEKKLLLEKFNDTATDYPRNHSIAQLFAKQAAQTPAATALEFESVSLSYKELDEKANQLACYLREKYSLQTGDIAGIQSERNEWLIITVLAVIKTGAAYVPVDTAYPQERIDYMLNDCGCKVLIDNNELVLFQKEADHYPITELAITRKADDLAYIMYTSGSTGTPKGVMVEDRSIVRLVKGVDYVSLTGSETVLSTGSFSFDATTFEYWGMLLNGGRLVLCSQDTLMDAQRLAEEIRSRKVDMMWFTAGWLHQLVDNDISLFSGLKTVLAGGDKLSPPHIQRLLNEYPSLQIVNGYGPTENTTFSLTCQIKREHGSTIPIGQPLSNSTAYIIDNTGMPVPIGITGEICLGGDGLARGYFNNPSLTAEKFVVNPFKPGERMYKTGDLGRWTINGLVEFVGRKDEQVKIRGYRVEPGEIETALLLHETIENAVVVAKTVNDSEKILLAYITGKDIPGIAALRSFLSMRLPVYMIPDYIIQLDALPLTANGKVDKRKLPDPEEMQQPAAVEYIAPRNAIEEKLVTIWNEILGEKNSGVKNDFFLSGGQSLKAGRLVSLISKELGVRLTLKDIFSKPILEEQALLIAQQKNTLFAHIPAAKEQSKYVLSSAQRRVWIASQFEEGNSAYNMPGAYVIKGTLNRAALEKSFAALIARHESLRTVFREDEEGMVRQYILPAAATGFHLAYEDLRDANEQDKKITLRVRQEAAQPFNLAEGPLVRAGLIMMTADEWVLTVTVHHIISDAWSVKVFISELLRYYKAFCENGEYVPTPLRIQYKDYAEWQQAQLTADSFNIQKAYWQQQFEDGLPDPCIIPDKVRPAVKTYNGEGISLQLNNDLYKAFKKFNRDNGISSFISLAALLKLLLYKYSGQEDIVIGTTVTGREHIDLEDQVGFYINTLALRTKFDATRNCSDMISRVKQTVLNGYENQAYPFDELVHALNLQRDMSRHPLFDVLLEWQEGNMQESIAAENLQDISIRPFDGQPAIQSKFDLRFVFTEAQGGMGLFIEFCTDVFNRSTIEQMAVHLECLLENIVTGTDKPVYLLDYMREEERNTVLYSFNKTAVTYPSSENIITLFDKQAVDKPSQTAVSFKQTNLSYAKLAEQSVRLASSLSVKYGVSKGDRVGVLLDRSEKMIIAILGILRAGATYVPVDPSYPSSRQEYIVNDAGIKILVTQTDYLFELTYFTGTLFAIDLQLNEAGEYDLLPAITIHPYDPAYVIYTSGSTGKPKGCMISHGSFANYIQWANSYYFKGKADAGFGLFTSLSFDLTITSIFCALTKGAELYVYDQQEELSSVLVHAFGPQSRQNSIKLTPSHISMLKHLAIDSSAMACAVVGGEELTLEQVSILKKLNPAIEIYNEYGPTEATVGCVVKKVEENTPVLIGRPIANATIYILDKYLQPCAVNVPGEICIGGSGLAIGYLNRPELTDQKFVPNPFREGERVYSTGDLGKWLNNGELCFLGRRDEQVKIKGYRIETGEVEKTILGYTSINEAVVDVRVNRQNDKELVAYYVSGKKTNNEELRSYLFGILPVYMVPSAFMQLDAIPLTVNGKIDRSKLPDPREEGNTNGPVYAPPRNEGEEELVKIWQEVLDKEQIGIRHNFFESGGDSIKVLRMISEVRKRTGISIPVAEMYKHSSIESISAFLSANKTNIEDRDRVIKETETVVIAELDELRNRVMNELPAADAARIEDIYPMSDIEKGMIFESAVNSEVSVYHDQKIYARSFLNFDPELFRQALQLVTEKHTILRSSFDIENYSTEIKLVRKNVAVPYYYEDISHLLREEQVIQVNRYMEAERKRPFDFTVAPLWRMSVFSLGDDEYAFLLQCHHAILDGWSETSLVAELNNIYLELREYPGYKPAALKSGYKDFIIQHLADKKDESIRNFWKEELTDCARLNLFEEGEEYAYHLVNTGSDHLQALEAFAVTNGTTVKVVSLSAYLYMLKVLNYDDEIVTGLVTHNRPQCEEADKILGCFLNTIPLRMVTDDACTAADWVKQVHNKLIDLKDNERLSMMDISLLHNRHQRTGNPFFDVLFNHIDFYVIGSVQTGQAENEAGLKETAIPVNSYVRGNTFFDFSISTTGGSYSVSLNLRKKLRCGFTPARVIELYLTILNAMVKEPRLPLSEISCMNEDDREKVFTIFNEVKETYPTSRSVMEVIAENAARHPYKTAVVYKEKELSYADLVNRATSVAAYLRNNVNAATDVLFGVMMDRSEKMMVTVLGVWQAGSAYVPLDMNFPDERIIQIIKASGMVALLVDSSVPEELLLRLALSIPVINVDHIDLSATINHAALPVIEKDLSALAYVIYTSGSTGQPKGVMIEHFGMINHIGAKIIEMGIDADSRVAQNATHTFDISVWQLFAGPVAGGTTVIYDQDTVAEPVSFTRQIAKDNITVLETVPSYFVEMLSVLEEKQAENQFSHLKILILNAETLMHSMVKRWLALQPGIPIVNTYGATEASDDISHYIMNSCPETATVPVLKKTIQHFEVYIVNKHLKPVPPGITGEILLAGPAVGRGYLNDAVKTAQAFLKGPLSGLTQQQRIYRTGDLGRFLSDGRMEFLGRQDSQVKIRGHRIELGEIEQTITAAEGIENAVLIADTEHQLLIAYYQSAEELPKDTIRDFLRKKLPEYMLPHYYIWMAAFPLTPNGKINKRALPAPDISSLQPAYIAPASETEEQLALIWMEVLNREKAGRNDNFFDLGGHSLKITRLAAQIHRVFNVKLPLRKLFATPVLEDQALLIVSEKENLFTAINPAPEQQSYPLSASQRRMWVLSQFEESNTAYNMPGIFMLKGALDEEAFANALQLLAARHESLRTIFRQDDTGEIRQYILPQGKMEIHPAYTDLRNETDPEAIIDRHARLQFSTAFNLAAGPLWKINIYQVSDNRWVLIYVIHHIISDGWSMGILFNELMIAYDACLKNKPLPLPALRIQYKDYAAWQQQQLTNERMNTDRQYWLSQFEGPLPVLEMPGDYPRPAVKTFNGSAVTGKIDSELTAALTQFTRERGATLFMGLLAAVNALLYRYTGQQDIIVGSPVAGREHADLDNQIGLYVNTIALRTTLKEEQSFTELLEQVKQNTIGAYEHQQYPFDELVNDLHLPRDTSRNALFEVMVVLQNAGTGIQTAAHPENLEVNPYTGTAAAMSKFDLVFNFTESAGAIYLHTEYNSDIYAKNTIERLITHLQQLLRSVLVEPDQPVSAIDYLSAPEKDVLLKGFNDTATSYPSAATAVALFEEQVNAAPDNIALICNGKIFTYNELNENANRLAAYLRKKYRVKPGDLVVICLERGQQMATAILGILKSGAAYVPADPEYPAGRIQYMVEDSRCKVVIDTEELEKFYAVQHKYSAENPKRVNQYSDPAYVVYTSGSTGQPKGVIVEHRSLINLCYWHNRHFSVTRNDRATLYAGVGFDAAVWEFFPYLLTGAALYTVPADIRVTMEEMAAFYRNNKITISFLPTQVAEQFMATGNNSLRYLLTGGDKLVSFTPVNYTVVNNYGPSENTVVATSFIIQQHQHNIPVGKPVDNNQVYILDSRQQLCPLGITGEICISGDSLARGYWNRPGLTDEKFVPNPFRKGAKMYKTGDLGRWLPDGNIEFAGRKDEQVKIRGHRVEPGEVENALLTFPGIISAVVIAVKKEDGQNELAAYLVSNETPDPAAIRDYLSAQLPAYMIPTRFVSLEAMPLTPNGKIDKKQLPDALLSGVTATARYTTPRNSTEEKIVNCWKKILGVEKISVHDNFFELGGHSLTITHLAGQLYKELGVKISFPELFTAETVEQQAVLVQQKKTNNFVSIPPAVTQPHYPLSSAQHLFWLVSQFEEGSIAYNIPGVMQLEGDLDTAVFSRAYHILVQRHESLRTVFRKIADGTVRQFILQADEPGFAISLHDFSTNSANPDNLFTFIQEEIGHPFDLFTGPLIRSFLIKTGDRKWVFCYIIHHIVGDGWSMHILSNELCRLYNACKAGEENPLQPLRIQYKDYAVWQLDQLKGKDLLKQKAYWLKQLEGELPVLELKYDRPRPVVKTYNGDVVLKTIESPVAEKFEKLLRAKGATLFMGLLAAVNTLLHRYSGQEDIIIGTSVAGREHADLSDQVGYYLNTLALRTRFSGNDDFNKLLNNVKNITLNAFENQQYPFEELVNSLNLQRDISRNNLFDVFVVMGDSDYPVQQHLHLDGVQVKGVPETAQEVSKFDLTFNFTETNEGIRLYAEYNTDLFNRLTIEKTCDHFEALLNSIIKNPDSTITSLNYLGVKEQQELLEKYNRLNPELYRGRTIPDLIRDKAAKSPGEPVFPDTSFSYKNLDELSAQLAGYLTKHYPGIHDRITVLQLNNREMMAAAMLTIQKCGGAYRLPDNEDFTTVSEAELLLNDKLMDHFTATAHQYPVDFTPASYNPDQAAMILSVSGEKDKQAFVRVKYGSLLNYLHWNVALVPAEAYSPVTVTASTDETTASLCNKLTSYLRNPLVTGTHIQQVFSTDISADF